MEPPKQPDASPREDFLPTPHSPLPTLDPVSFGEEPTASFNPRRAFFREIVVVAWVLTVLFFLARTQGYLDARRDAVNDTSTLPVITFVTKEDSLGLGRQLNDETIDSSPKNFRVIGDRGLYEQWIGRELNNTTDSNSSDIIVWRLLIDINSQFYIFPTLSKDAPETARPPVVVSRNHHFFASDARISPYQLFLTTPVVINS